MTESERISTPRPLGLRDPNRRDLNDVSTLELAQALAERLALKERDWHRLKSDRKVRAGEQMAAALVFLLKGNPEESLPRLEQAVGWLNRSIFAPPCPQHGKKGNEPRSSGSET